MSTNSNADKYQMDSRLGIVFSVFFLLLLVVLGKAIYLKTAKYEHYKNREKETTQRDKKIEAKRGNIYAIDPDNGEYLLLATNESQYDVYIDLGECEKKSKGVTVKEYVISDKSFNRGVGPLSDSLARLFQDSKNPKSAAGYKKYFLENI